MNFKLAILLFFTTQISFAQVVLPRFISSGMVLQRDTKLKIWGWASPKEKLTIFFKEKKYSCVANETGDWQIILPKQKASSLPTTIKFIGKNEIVLTDILIGDVWLCSGQSNMEQPMGGRLKYKYAVEIATANNKYIRQFLVPDKYNFIAPQKDVDAGEWLSVTSSNIANFTAIGYFFVKELHEKYKIPIGLINAALGGSPAEAWVSENALKKLPEYYNEMQKWKDKSLILQTEKNDNSASKNWNDKLIANDEGIKNNWKNTLLNDDDWLTIFMPDKFISFSSGVVWLRKEIFVATSMVGKNAKLELGRINDADSVFLNGQFVGNTTYQYPARRYELSSTILKEGKNVIVIRVVTNGGNGGLVTNKKYELTTATDTVNLSGNWKYKIGAHATQSAPASTSIRFKPGGLHNAMIAPISNYAMKGILWYQGETNSNYPEKYAVIMQTLITDWRTAWQKKIPFLFVQLPNYMDAKPTPQRNSKWAILRQQQLLTLKIANTAMAIAIDLGEWNDIHPENKKDVAHRLFLLADNIVYGEKKVVSSGPLYQSMKSETNKIILSFSNIGSGLISKDGNALRHFAIAGVDGKYVLAKATIKNNKIEVSSSEVIRPVAVKYAWADNPENVNFYNKEGLPASPFEAKFEKK